MGTPGSMGQPASYPSMFCGRYSVMQVPDCGLPATISSLTSLRTGWRWSAILASSVDTTLQRTSDVVATSDSAILDRAARWFDLAGAVVQQVPLATWCVDLNVPPPMVG